jgi:hypothetical protein
MVPSWAFACTALLCCLVSATSLAQQDPQNPDLPDAPQSTPEPLPEAPAPAPTTQTPEAEPALELPTRWGPGTADMLAAPPYAFGGRASGRKIALTANPGALIVGRLGFDLGIAVGDRTSLNFMGERLSADDVSGGGIGAGAQVFFGSDERLKGVYVYPRIIYAWATVEASGTDPMTGYDRTLEASASLLGIGATAGYQFNWGFVLRLGGGVIYYVVAGESGDDVEISAAGIAIVPELAIGFSL